MKPKDLKSVFSWETRKPLLKDKVLYVPEYYFKHEEFTVPCFKEIFGNNNPIDIEFCSGNGDWVINKAKENPNRNWIAVEKLHKRVRKIWSKRENFSLDNLLIVCGEALTYCKYYLKSHCISSVFINFPDPWPKERHAKHRLIKPMFLDELSKIVQEKGTMTIVTDDVEYKNSIIDICLAHKKFLSLHPYPYYKSNIDDYGYSYFHDLWKGLGKTIHHISFINQ